MKQSPLPPDYFRNLYADSADPWNLAGSEYERRKYQTTLAALPERRFSQGLEAGCAIGVMTRLLAQRVENLLAVDLEEVALRQARAHCAGLDNVGFARMKLPGQWPDGTFDLIMVSEVLYYLSPQDIAETAARCRRGTTDDAAVVLVHWTHPTDLPMDGDEAVQLFLDAAASDLVPTRQIRTDDYRIDVLSARPISER